MPAAAHDYPTGPRRVAAAIGAAMLGLFLLAFPFALPPLLVLSGRPIAALLMTAVLTPVVLLLAGLAFWPDWLQRALRRFTRVDLRDGGHVAALVVMTLTLFYVLGLQTVAGVAAVEDALAPPAAAEAPPTTAAAGAPAAPNVTTANLTADGIRLEWSMPPGGADAERYRVYRAVSPGAASFHATVENATNYTDARATGGFQYVYQVTAVGAQGESLPSNATAVLVPVDTNLMYAGLMENLFLMVLPAILYVSFVHHAGPRGALQRLGFRQEGALRAILWGFGAVLAFLVLAEFAARGVQQFQELPENERAQAIGLGVGLSGAFLLAAASSVSEEVLFRGFLQPRIGVWGQAVVFAVAHLSYVNVVEIVVVFLLALVFGFLYKRTGNLWGPIAAHFAFNLLSVIAIVCTADPAQCGLPAAP